MIFVSVSDFPHSVIFNKTLEQMAAERESKSGSDTSSSSTDETKKDDESKKGEKEDKN